MVVKDIENKKNKKIMFIKKFQQISKGDADVAGGKGASLGEMTSIGVSVSPGFVVLADAFALFLKETDLNVEIDAVLDTVDIDAIHTVEKASEKIQAMILLAEMPAEISKTAFAYFKELDANFVAVRSSATSEDSADAAWAGQLDSFLNTTEETLLENIKKCWASLFTPRAIFYRFEKGLHNTNILVAVVVQKMIQAEKSGIAFSVHPVTEDYNQLIIEAGFGLGESVVSGSITPDSYVVDKSRVKNYELGIKNEEPKSKNYELGSQEVIIDINISAQTKGLYGKDGGGNEWRKLGEEGEQQVLNEGEILELSKLIIQIENHYGFPCDIEWAQEGGEFYITQSRPITTLEKAGGNINKKEDDLNIEIGKSSDYQRIFRWKSLNFLVTSFFMSHYKVYNTLVISTPQDWTNYIPNKVFKKTLEEGFTLYGDNKKYKEYVDAFDCYMKSVKDTFEDGIKKGTFENEWMMKMLGLMTKCFKYCSKTEFFYTDKAYSNQESNLNIKKNFEKFELLKTRGRIFLNKVFLEGGCFLNAIIEAISRKYNIKESDLTYYHYEEILNLFEGRKVNVKEIERRKEYFVFKSINKEIEIFSGNEAKELVDSFRMEEQSSIIKGIVAYKGNIVGRAKVFYYGVDELDSLRELVDSMKKGDVLVAETTSPEIMAACKKASAIITSQGGMMSHAAIIARELKIPCIVGTDIAAQVLKDGDLVEVDASKGVVRVLERVKMKGDNEKFNADSEIVNDLENKNKITGDSMDSFVKYMERDYTLRDLSIATWSLLNPGFFKEVYYTEAFYCMKNGLVSSYVLQGDIERINRDLSSAIKDSEYINNAIEEGTRTMSAVNNISDRKIVKNITKNSALKLLNEAEKAWNQFGIFFEFTHALGRIDAGLSNKHLGELGKFHNERKVVFLKFFQFLESLCLSATEKDLDIVMKNLSYLTISEIKKYFSGESSVSEVNALQNNRLDGYVYCVKSLRKEGMIMTDYEDKRVKELVSRIKHEKVNDFKGISVSSGISKGEVKIISINDNLENQKDLTNKIIVTTMTTPTMDVFLKKVRGIITEEGGILCHAAIFAREFDLPTITLVKDVTKILKDGDLVEVDADKGVVTILK